MLVEVGSCWQMLARIVPLLFTDRWKTHKQTLIWCEIIHLKTHCKLLSITSSQWTQKLHEDIKRSRSSFCFSVRAESETTIRPPRLSNCATQAQFRLRPRATNLNPDSQPTSCPAGQRSDKDQERQRVNQMRQNVASAYACWDTKRKHNGNTLLIFILLNFCLHYFWGRQECLYWKRETTSAVWLKNIQPRTPQCTEISLS